MTLNTHTYVHIHIHTDQGWPRPNAFLWLGSEQKENIFHDVVAT